MTSRFVLAVGLAFVMLICGTSTFIYVSSKQSRAVAPPQKPTASSPRPQALVLPGTLYLTQSGALYSLNSGRFHQLTSEVGWEQPSLLPDGNLMAVRQLPTYSEVFVLNKFGTVTRQITDNAAPPGNKDLGYNHWSFYPRLGIDGQTLWMTYDGLKCHPECFDVSLAVWSMPFNGSIRQARAWTDGGFFSGGDVQPIPMPDGGVVYTKYGYGPDNKLVGQLWYTNRANSYGRPLTDPYVDCRSPSLSPDHTRFAMICTYEKQISYLTIANWTGATLGPLKSVITNQLVAQPTWAPDGSGIAYYAPDIPDGPFQLWWLPKGAYEPPPPSPPPSPTPGGPHNGPLPTPTPPPPPPAVKPIQVTTNNGFDATSPMAWG